MLGHTLFRYLSKFAEGQQTLVTNSIPTALFYPEYDFEILSGSMDQHSMQKWHRLLTAIFKNLMMAKYYDKREVKRHKISIIITTFQRTHLLRWGLSSLARQTIPFEFETIVVNDGLPDETEKICNEFKEKLNLKYIFTGQRNLNGNLVWRVPGFAINIGVK